MRRALREQLPAFSSVYGIQPWDIDRMNLAEINTYSRDLDRRREEAAKYGE